MTKFNATRPVQAFPVRPLNKAYLGPSSWALHLPIRVIVLSVVGTRLSSSDMSSPSWKELATQKKAQQLASIPKEWLLPDPPPSEQLDISSIPESCGLLSDLEITITNTPVEGLLPKLASGEWSAVVVTTAFYKRAIIAHQLVSFRVLAMHWMMI
jgi:hypothetical protein